MAGRWRRHPQLAMPPEGARPWLSQRPQVRSPAAPLCITKTSRDGKGSTSGTVQVEAHVLVSGKGCRPRGRDGMGKKGPPLP